MKYCNMAGTNIGKKEGELNPMTISLVSLLIAGVSLIQDINGFMI